MTRTEYIIILYNLYAFISQRWTKLVDHIFPLIQPIFKPLVCHSLRWFEGPEPEDLTKSNDLYDIHIRSR